MYLIAQGLPDWQSGKVLCADKQLKGNSRRSKSRVVLHEVFHGGMVLWRRKNQKTLTPLFIGRWTPKILFSLNERPHRHGELRRHLGSISQRMLTRTLRSLESKGLIGRRIATSKAIAVEYSLTQLGASIIAPLRGMCRWAKTYGRPVSAEVYFAGAHQKD